MHPNEELLRREYDARARGELSALEEVFHEDIVWHVPGRSAIAGTYRGRDDIRARLEELAGLRAKKQRALEGAEKGEGGSSRTRSRRKR